MPLVARDRRSLSMRVGVLDTVDTSRHRDDGRLVRGTVSALQLSRPLIWAAIAALAPLALIGAVAAGWVPRGTPWGTWWGGDLHVDWVRAGEAGAWLVVAGLLVLLAGGPARSSHGGPLDCVSCHAGPGSGSWGGTQNWVGGAFSHAPSSIAGTTCVACHATQRPDLVLGQTAAAALLPDHFDHAVKGTADCFSCHQSAKPSLAYFAPSGTFPGGAWSGGIGDPDGVRDPAQDISVLAEVPTYAGTSIVSVAAQTEKLPMPMDHSSATVQQTMSCSACHASAATGVFFPGRLHASLSTQPSACLDCHATSAPTGFVGPIDDQRLISGDQRIYVVLVRADGDLAHLQRAAEGVVVNGTADLHNAELGGLRWSRRRRCVGHAVEPTGPPDRSNESNAITLRQIFSSSIQ